MSRLIILILLSIVILLAPNYSLGFDPLDVNNEYDYVIITHDSFYSTAIQLRDHRALQFRSCVVKTSEIQANFSGTNDVEKIRDFVLFAYQNWKIAPTYLLLVGDANMVQAADPAIIEASAYNTLPTMLMQNPYDSFHENEWYANDGYYVNPPDDDMVKPIMHLGRLSVRTNEELQNVLDKILYYDGITGSPDWLEKILMLVGDMDYLTDNGEYRVFNDQLFDNEFAGWNPNPEVVYSEDYSTLWPDDITEIARDEWNNGYGYINAYGQTHSYDFLVWLARVIDSYGPNFSEVLDPSSGALPVLFIGSCVGNYFYRDIEYCIGEDLLFHTNNTGAIAVIGATHINDIIESYEINRIFAHQFIHEGVRNVGQLFSAAKGLFLEQEFGHEYLGEQYVLLGDPGIEIKVPKRPSEKFVNGFEIEDAVIFQNSLVSKSEGINLEHTRIVHKNSADAVLPLISDRMFKASMLDEEGESDYVEWILQEGIGVEITPNMHFSFWINVVESPDEKGRVCLDGNTTGGRIKDNFFILDQDGYMLDAKNRHPVSPGWRFYYVDLSPMQGETLLDLRLRYETTVASESGNMLVYLDDIRFENEQVGGSYEEILNASFENDKDENGTPDFWTDTWGQTETPVVLRRDIEASTGQYSMQVFNEYCVPEMGAQHVFHTNQEFPHYMVGFSYYAPDSTTFTMKVIDVATGEEVVNRSVTATSAWTPFYGDFENPSFGFGSRRMIVQFLPDECERAIFIDNISIRMPIVTNVDESIPVFTKMKITAFPNPFNPITTFSYEIAKAGKIRLQVFDIKGRLVKTIFEGRAICGIHNAEWDGKNNANVQMPSGTYFARIETGNGSSSLKITLVK